MTINEKCVLSDGQRTLLNKISTVATKIAIIQIFTNLLKITSII